MTRLVPSRAARRRLIPMVAAATAALVSIAPAAAASSGPAATTSAGLPVGQIEKILKADGTVDSGVLDVEINRSDVHVTGPRRTPFVVGFQIQHEFFFQSLGRHRAILNGDMSLKQAEMQPVIDALLAHHLQFQAEHQHLYNITPMMWFVHFRGVGDPVTLADAAAAAIAKTSTPLPQSSPAHPKTPLPAGKLASILGGSATIGDNGVVTVTVPHKTPIKLGGIRISPDLGVSTNVQFQPLPGGRAAVVPDISMTSTQVNRVVTVMRHAGWESGCLYNQETAESPQLYFDHFFKTGDPMALARQTRAALNNTDA